MMMPRRAIEPLTGFPLLATFKDVVGSTINRQVIERQLEQARLAEEWRHNVKGTIGEHA